jgi:hypothetical protein
MRDIVRSAVFKQNDEVIKANLSTFFLSFQQFGINVYNDVDRVFYVVVRGVGSAEMLVLLHGTFETRKLQEMVEKDKRFRRFPVPKTGLTYYGVPGGAGEPPLFVAMPNANTFVSTAHQPLMVNALLKAAGVQALELTDKDVQRELENWDDKLSVLLVLGGSIPTAKGTLLDGGIRSMSFGFAAGDDLRAEYRLVVRDARAYEGLKARAVPFLGDFLAKNLDETGTLATGLAGAQPNFNDTNHTMTVRVRHTAADAAKILKR